MLEGLGTLRIDGEEIQVSEDDYVALPAKAEGAPAHQFLAGGALVPLLLHEVGAGRDSPPRLQEGGHFGGAAPAGPNLSVA